MLLLNFRKLIVSFAYFLHSQPEQRTTQLQRFYKNAPPTTKIDERFKQGAYFTSLAAISKEADISYAYFIAKFMR